MNSISEQYRDIIYKCKFISKADKWYIEGTEAKCDYICCDDYKLGDKFNSGWGLFEGYVNDGELPCLDGETCKFYEFFIYDEHGNEISELTLEEYKLLIEKHNV